MFENPRRGKQARNFTTNVPKNSSSQIVFRTDIFLKIAVGCPWELDSRFESLVGFRIPQSKFPEFQILNFHKQKFSGIRITIHGATTGLRDVALPQRWRQLKRHWKLTSRPRPNSERYSKIYASCRSRPRENLRIGHFTSELFWGQRDLATWYT